MSRISAKNQITIPIAALRAAGLEPGDDVQVRATGRGHLELVKTDADAVIERYAGVFDDSVYPEGYLERQRAEWPE
jgi:bifunctional DNA-binding transcriptional regulator/antitoxin component of YhaV-PrlF toxin-antitoxin module